MDAGELLRWLLALPADARDRALEARWGIAAGVDTYTPPGEHLIGYHPSGLAAIARALLEASVGDDDVVVDLGAGLGKVLLLARVLTGAVVRGIELQPALVEGARASAARLGVEATFVQGDVRDADLSDGTVFFLYAPFVGPVLAEALRRIREVARRRAIVVCALGIDLDRDAPWLAARPIDSFWLTVYDSVIAGASPRAARPLSARAPLDAVRPMLDAIARERPFSE